MPVKTTQKEIKRNYSKVYKFSYCEIQALLNNLSPTFYTTRAAGWGCNIYIIDGVALTTGYAPFGTDTPYKLVQKYDCKAQKINSNYERTQKSKETGLKRLQRNMIKELNNLNK